VKTENQDVTPLMKRRRRTGAEKQRGIRLERSVSTSSWLGVKLTELEQIRQEEERKLLEEWISSKE